MQCEVFKATKDIDLGNDSGNIVVPKGDVVEVTYAIDGKMRGHWGGNHFDVFHDEITPAV